MPDITAQAAFFITPLGSEGSDIRERADEIQSLIAEVAVGHGIVVSRADQLGESGMISEQIVRRILEARMIFADLTGANANVYYELGVAHSFGRPVVTMVDKARDLTFDTAHDRAIIIGDDGRLSLAQGRRLKEHLSVFIERAMSGQYEATNVVTYAASRASMEDLAGDNPVLTMVGQTYDSIESLRRLLEDRDYLVAGSSNSDAELLRRFVARILPDADVDLGNLRNSLLDGRTSVAHDRWLEQLIADSF